MLRKITKGVVAFVRVTGQQMIGWGIALLLSLGFGVATAAASEISLSAGSELAEVTADIEIVNINEADAETIAKQLVGVGMRRAEAIVEYRETYGPFYSAEELKVVKGIGRATVERNRDRIRIK
jgi:competence protein ComEA